jgi:hypothetical protein
MKIYQVVDPDEVVFLIAGMIIQEELDDLIAFLLTQYSIPGKLYLPKELIEF